MKNASSNTSLRSLIKDPSQLADIVRDPKSGIDFYNGLSAKEQQYIVFAAAAGLIAYGIYLGRQNK
ncbi:hypothetical protein POKO110462_12720 [Pontibacter korlensis]|uniref:Uncharacterized protein n=1 Tax=Pontibacter korlensis TaxID=400092 RepID=A0A0E3ZHB7_9BACT|nr:hypothetical protein [Pontibacter korlensis]AKD03998.1 hypothetical protein PKOR_13925 [Pontibacter korlensis]